MLIQPAQWKIVSPPPASPGLLVGIENPTLELSQAAKKILQLPNEPQALLVGIRPVTLKGVTGFSPLEQAIVDTGVSAIEMFTTEAAKSTNIPLVGNGVKAFWIGVKVWKLHNKWKDPKRNIPSLLIESTSVALTGLRLGVDATGLQGTFFDSDTLHENIDIALTGLDAAVHGEDVAIALMNKKFADTEVGRIFDMASPLFNAALSEDPTYSGVRFTPFPQLYAPPV